MSGKVVIIGICKAHGNEIDSVKQVDAITGMGLLKDRHFKEKNEKKSQITLIEIENIDNYNKTSKNNIQPIKFRRNIITEGVRLNELVGKDFFINDVKLRGHDLCRPCKTLQQNLKQKDIIKNFLRTGGLRCEILSSGKISVGDIIKQYND